MLKEHQIWLSKSQKHKTSYIKFLPIYKKRVLYIFLYNTSTEKFDLLLFIIFVQPFVWLHTWFLVIRFPQMTLTFGPHLLVLRDNTRQPELIFVVFFTTVFDLSEL